MKRILEEVRRRIKSNNNKKRRRRRRRRKRRGRRRQVNTGTGIEVSVLSLTYFHFIKIGFQALQRNLPSSITERSKIFRTKRYANK